MSVGWLKLHRQIEQNWIWKDPRRAVAWIHFLFRANYEDTTVLIGNEEKLVPRGSFITSIRKLSDEVPLSYQETRTFLNLLESNAMINATATQKLTQITICKYEDYQDKQRNPPKKSTQPATTDKEGKEEKKKKETSSCDSVGENKMRKITPKQFETFWKIYPGKKADKGKCLSKWKTICGWQGEPVPTWSEIRRAILAQMETERWADKKFIPLPHTWLNQRRWMDDPKEMTLYQKRNGNAPSRIRKGGAPKPDGHFDNLEITEITRDT